MKKSVGRPRINKHELTKPVASAFTPSLRKALEIQAAREGKTLSHMIAYSCQRLINARKIAADIGLT